MQRQQRQLSTNESLDPSSLGPSCCTIVDGNARQFVPVQCVTDVSIENAHGNQGQQVDGEYDVKKDTSQSCLSLAKLSKFIS